MLPRLIRLSVLAAVLAGTMGAASCDHGESLGNGVRLIELDSYTLIVDEATGRNVLLAPHIEEWALNDDHVLGMRREIQMPMQTLSKDPIYFIFDTVSRNAEEFDAREHYSRAAAALGIDLESVVYQMSSAPVGE